MQVNSETAMLNGQRLLRQYENNWLKVIKAQRQVSEERATEGAVTTKQR